MTQNTMPYIILPAGEHGHLYSILPDGGIVLMADLFAEMLRMAPIPVKGGKVTFVPDAEPADAPTEAPAQGDEPTVEYLDSE